MDLIVPESGSTTLHLYLPSGALLELQVYLNAGEDAKAVLSQLMDSEGLPASLLPDALSVLRDIFEIERALPVSPLKAIPARDSADARDEGWREYSRLFESPSLVAELKLAERDLQSRHQRAEEIYYATIEAEEQTAARLSEGSYSDTELQGMVMAHAEKLQEVAKDFERAKLQIKEDYWTYVSALKTSDRKPEEVKAKTFESFKEFEVSIGAQVRRNVSFGLVKSEDPCDIPYINVPEPNKQRKPTSSQLTHPENIYKKAISCLVVPCYFDSRGLQTMTELLRCCECSAEFHFPTIREQLTLASKSQTSTFYFTRHSNLQGIEGVFHVPSPSLLKAAVQFADQHSVLRVCFPIEEWEDKQLSPEALMRAVKAALYERQSGSIRSVLFTTDGAATAKLYSQLQAVFM